MCPYPRVHSVFKQLFLAAKIEKNIKTKNSLRNFYRFLLMCAMHLQQVMSKDGLIFLSGVCLLARMFPSEEKVCIHPTEPDLRVRKKNCYIKNTEISANLANVLIIH